MMGAAHENSTDPYAIDPLRYLADLDDNLSAAERREHYDVLRLALSRIQNEDPATFDLALQEISKKLKIKAKAVRADLDALEEPSAAKEARELLEQMGQTRTLRLAHDFVDNRLWYGVVAGENTLLLNSDRQLLTLDELPAGLAVKDNGFDYCRLSKEAILKFLKIDTVEGPALLADLRQFFTRFAVFRDKRIPLLLATWTLGTYCYRVFRVFPYLALRSPAKRCGKSRILDLLFQVAFNASPKTIHPTEAQLFRSPSRNGGTLLLDEVEALGKKDKDTYAGLLAVLNSGFEQNGTVERQVKEANGNFKGVNFETYSPRAIAGINKTADTLEDRSVIIMMQRKRKGEKIERFSPRRLEKEAQDLRDCCYLWSLTQAATLADVYERADQLFSVLDALDDRARDLWEPLVSITSVIDTERADMQKTITEELTSLASDLCEVRDGAAEDSTTVQVINALREILGAKSEVVLTPTDLTALIRDQLGWEKLSTKGLASLLNPLELYSKNTRFDTRKVTLAYHLSAQHLAELHERYGRGDAQGDEKK